MWLSGIPTRKHGKSLSKGSYPSDCVHGRSPIIQRRSGAHRCPLETPVCGPWWFKEQGPLKKSGPCCAIRCMQASRPLIHCLSGRHRAGIGGCVFRALLAQESWDVAVALCQELQALVGHSGGSFMKRGMRSWVDTTIRTSSLRNPFPEPCGYIATLSFQGPPGAQQRPDPLLPQAICRACNPLGEANDDAGHEGGYGLGAALFVTVCLVRAAASWHPR